MVKISLNTGVKTVIIKNIWLCHFFLITLASLLASSLWKYIFSKSRLQGLTKNKSIFRFLTQAFPQNFYDYLSSLVLPIAHNVPALGEVANFGTDYFLLKIKFLARNKREFTTKFAILPNACACCTTQIYKNLRNK